MSFSPDIPPAYRALYDAAGPVVRFRLVRDVLDRDESYLQTAHLALDLPRLPETEAIITAQELDGSWNGLLCSTENCVATETAVLRLCELGLEEHDSIRACVEKALVPTLLGEDILWEFSRAADDDNLRPMARRIVRDKTLRLLTRATRSLDEMLRPVMEALLIEGEHFLAYPHAQDQLPPTADGYAALCWYKWSDDDFLRVRKFIKRLFKHAEDVMGHSLRTPEFYAPHVFQLSDKWEYLSRPPLFFHELELAARLGAARDLAVTKWLIEELEFRQDADGRFRFESAEPVEDSWYYPLDRKSPRDDSLEWTFRAALLYKLLEYDL
ncbi:hypothetical protein KKH27_07860 [bacterium]|nr:hypothetical protein [bacterium]MBU1983230.1 hypothetical protein [bacterium]